MQALIGKQVEFQLAGIKKSMRGRLIDIGEDVIAVYNGTQFLYIPTHHLYTMSSSGAKESDSYVLPDLPFIHQNDLSYRKILMQAKGTFTELILAGNQSVHGYLTSIMNDYFVFHSPVYRTLYVSMQHLKAILPYSSNVTPFLLQPDQLPFYPAPLSLARSFEQQLKKLEGKIVILDLGEDTNKTGLLRSMNSSRLELVTADGRTVYLNSHHVHTVHLP